MIGGGTDLAGNQIKPTPIPNPIKLIFSLSSIQSPSPFHRLVHISNAPFPFLIMEILRVSFCLIFSLETSLNTQFYFSSKLQKVFP